MVLPVLVILGARDADEHRIRHELVVGDAANLHVLVEEVGVDFVQAAVALSTTSPCESAAVKDPQLDLSVTLLGGSDSGGHGRFKFGSTLAVEAGLAGLGERLGDDLAPFEVGDPLSDFRHLIAGGLVLSVGR